MVRDEVFIRRLVRVVQRLHDFREERPERKLGDDVRKVHLFVVDVFVTRISVAQCGDVQVRRDTFDEEGA